MSDTNTKNYHGGYMKDFKKFGFTLAEVLITLGVIGVVASITMPMLIQNHQKHVTENRLKKSFSTLNQALKMSEVENGPAKYWDLDLGEYGADNTKKFTEKYILPYLKAEYCDSAISPGKCAKYVGCGTGSQNYTLADGTMIGICAYGHGKEIFISVLPIKTLKRGRIFSFIFDTEKGVLLPARYVAGLSREDIKRGYEYNGEGYTVGCSKDSDAEYPYHACTALIYVDGWKIRDDYPW